MRKLCSINAMSYQSLIILPLNYQCFRFNSNRHFYKGILASTVLSRTDARVIGQEQPRMVSYSVFKCCKLVFFHFREVCHDFENFLKNDHQWPTKALCKLFRSVDTEYFPLNSCCWRTFWPAPPLLPPCKRQDSSIHVNTLNKAQGSIHTMLCKPMKKWIKGVCLTFLFIFF